MTTILLRLSFMATLLSVLFTSCKPEVFQSEEVSTEEGMPIVRKTVVKFEESAAKRIEENPEVFVVDSKSFVSTDVLEICSVKRLFPDAGKFEERTRNEGLHRWYVIDYIPSLITTKASDILLSIEGIEVAEDLLHIKRTEVFDDPYLKYQWHYCNDGLLSEKHITDADINVVPVWEQYTKGNKDVVVAVVDGGIDTMHEDISSHCIGGYNFVQDNDLIVADEHGTHVAGTISAINNNGIGVAGIAGGDFAAGIQGVSLLSCQIFDIDPNTSQESSADGALAIKWAADHGAVIAQNSWGYVYSYSEAKVSDIPKHLKESIDYFIKYAGVDETGEQIGPMKGGVVIFAAGNEGWDANPICEYPPVIAVGSFGPNMKRTDYSNYGDWVDISAPGGDLNINNGGIMSTTPGNTYDFFQGTSMACPHVSGVASLIVSYYGGKGFTPDDLIKRLIGGASKDALKGEKIGPKLDAMGAFSYSTTPPEKVMDLKISAVGNSIDLRWSVVADQNNDKVDGFVLLVSKKSSFLESCDPDKCPSTVERYEFETGNKKVGDMMTGRIENLLFNQTYYLAIYSYDRYGNYSEMSDVMKVSTKNNEPPIIVVDNGNPNGIVVAPNEQVDLIFSATDPEGQEVQLSIDQNFSLDVLKIDSSSIRVTIKGNGNYPGVYQSIVMATDSEGAVSSYVLSYELLENQAPVIKSPLKDILLYGLNESCAIDLNEHFTDHDGDVLKYYVECSDDSVINMTLNNCQLDVVPIDFGVAHVTVKAVDTCGEESHSEFKVAVRNEEKPIMIYPNPISDYMYVTVALQDHVRFRIVSNRGVAVYDKTLSLSPFSDLKIDLRTISAGVYYVIVEGARLTLSTQIVKL